MSSSQTKNKKKSDYQKVKDFLGYNPKYLAHTYMYANLIRLAKGLRMRTANKYDNYISVTAYPGTGKSTFSFWGAHLTDPNFDMYKQTFWTEGTEQWIKVNQELPPQSSLWFDEAHNQFGKDESWLSASARIRRRETNTNRSEYKNYWLCSPSQNDFTKNMREGRIFHRIHILERGEALYQYQDTTNLVPGTGWHEGYLEARLKRIYSKRRIPTRQEIKRIWFRLPNTFKGTIKFPPLPDYLEKKYNKLKDERKREWAEYKENIKSKKNKNKRAVSDNHKTKVKEKKYNFFNKINPSLPYIQKVNPRESQKENKEVGGKE